MAFTASGGISSEAELLELKEMGTAAAISYTHLDVYKRQLLVFEQGKLVRQAVGARPKAGVLELLG